MTSANDLRVQVMAATIRRCIERGVLDRDTLKMRSGYTPPDDLLAVVMTESLRDLDAAMRLAKERYE